MTTTFPSSTEHTTELAYRAAQIVKQYAEGLDAPGLVQFFLDLQDFVSHIEDDLIDMAQRSNEELARA